jgi:hypothetical protein
MYNALFEFDMIRYENLYNSFLEKNEQKAAPILHFCSKHKFFW